MSDKDRQLEELEKLLIEFLDGETIEKVCEDGHGNLTGVTTYSMREVAGRLFDANVRVIGEGKIVLSSLAYRALKVQLAYEKEREVSVQIKRKVAGAVLKAVKERSQRFIENQIQQNRFDEAMDEIAKKCAVKQ